MAEVTSIQVVRTEISNASEVLRLLGHLLGTQKWFEVAPDPDDGTFEVTTRSDSQVPGGYKWTLGSY